MSEPVKSVGNAAETTAEIEDVLTSIRKLVSQDAKSARSRGVGSALVLTPDARVDATKRADGAMGDGGETGDRGEEAHAAAARAVRTELERALAELESAMGIPDDGTTAPEAPMATETDPVVDDLDWDAPVGRAMAGPPPAKPAPAQTEVESGEPEIEEALKRTMLNPRTKPKSALDRLRLVSSEAEQLNEPFEDAYGSARPMRPADIDIADHEEASLAEPAVVQEPEPNAVDAPLATDAVEPVVAEPTEPVVADAVQPAVTDAEQALGDIDTPTADEPEAPEDAFKMPPMAGEATHDDPYQSFDSDPAADEFEASLKRDIAFDDAELREIVADIVRQELQGALGEKITRNVRRLVRREINRALAGQDLI
ncbi:MAG: hypothetical protein AAF092_03695 [Pseudomonadota bacterium]